MKSKHDAGSAHDGLPRVVAALLTAATVIACNPANPSESASGLDTATLGLSTFPNTITGAGIANPNPTRIGQWAELPEGRRWGTSAGIAIDPTDGNVWGYERCGSGSAGVELAQGFNAAGPSTNCDNNSVDPIFKFDRHTGAILRNFGAGILVTPHGFHVDAAGNVWVTDWVNNSAGTKGQQVHKFSPDGTLLMSLGVAGTPGAEPGYFNQPLDVVTAADGSIFVSDGHTGQEMGTPEQIQEARAQGLTSRIIKFSPDGRYVTEWGQMGTEHGEFRTPHALAFDPGGRLWVADRGNHRIEIYDQNGNYLDSRYMFGRVSDVFITESGAVYGIDSESHRTRHPSWSTGIRVGRVEHDWVSGFIPPWETPSMPQGVTGEGVAVDADGNVYVAEGPGSLVTAGAAFTKYSVE